MELYVFILFGCTLLFTAHAEEGPLILQYENPTERYLEVGATNIVFRCLINRTPMWAMNNPLRFVRETAKGEVVLSTLGQLSTNAEPSHYDVTVSQEGNDIAMQLTIREVRDLDDGKLICRTLRNADESDTVDVAVDVWIIRPLTSLTMKFDNIERISESRDMPLEVDAGIYRVMCEAEGSNPGTQEVHLYLHGNPIDTDVGPFSEEVNTNPREYRSWMEGEVHIAHMNTGTDLECTASSRAGDTLSVRVPLKVNIYDPVTTCEDNQAFIGEKYAQVICTVDHEGLDIVKFKFQLGETGDIIEVGEQNDDYAEVEAERVDDSKTKITLELYKVDDWHFGTDYYILSEHRSGYVSKSQAITLTERQRPDDSGTSLVASVITLFLAAVCALLQSL